MRHNFAALSPIDFERLCADLLGAELNENFELFSAGADGGIDMRCDSKSLGLLIGQAKHYRDRSNLKQAVRKEVAKVQRLNPDRYFLLTSCPLNPATKDEFVQWLHPNCQNSGDIWGENELSEYLARHPSVLRRHVKLWLQDALELEQSLVSLLNKAKSSNGQFKLLVASRDYVINQAKERLPKLANWLQQNTPEFAVQIKYSTIPDNAKADILYNLIYFSSLQDHHRQAFVNKQSYWQVIRHRHFNPRLIKGLLNQLQNSTDKLLVPELMQALDNPTLYWENTFQRLSSEAQCLLYALAITLIQQTVAEEELSDAYAALYRELRGCYPPALGLQAAIAELEPNLILSQIKHQTLWFSFANPSVQDMVHGFLARHAGMSDAVINSMKYFSQGEFLLGFQRFSLDARQSARALKKMHMLVEDEQRFINEWDGELIELSQVSRITRLWQLYQQHSQPLSQESRAELLGLFTRQAGQANWEQWLAKGSMKHLLEIACQCLPDDQLPAMLDLALENIHNSQDAVEMLEAYIENSAIKKHLQGKLSQFIFNVERACFDEVSRVTDDDHLNQILSDVETLENLAEQDRKLSKALDLIDSKISAWQKLEAIYLDNDNGHERTAEEAQEMASWKRKAQEHQEQVEYVDSLFTTLDTELNCHEAL
jgi:hypothetical protein